VTEEKIGVLSLLNQRESEGQMNTKRLTWMMCVLGILIFAMGTIFSLYARGGYNVSRADGFENTVQLSQAAVEALKNPQKELAEGIRQELESVWKKTIEPILQNTVDRSDAIISAKLWGGKVSDKGYLHFYASGSSKNSRQKIVLEVYLGGKERIELQHGRWFNPVKMGNMFIERVDSLGDRAAFSTLTEDGTEAFYWQKNEHFIKVNKNSGVRSYAQQIHDRAAQQGFYNFPKQYLTSTSNIINTYDIPLLKASVSKVNLYESGSGGLDKNQRKYKTRFSKSESRYINWELNLEHPAPGQRKDFQIEFVYYYPDGSVFGRSTVDTYIQADWTSSYRHGSWGWRDPGNWRPGTYRIELFIEGQKIASKSFEITDSGGQSIDPGSGIPSLKANVTELNLYESGSGGLAKDQRQYKTRFSKSESRYINWELNLEHPAPGQRKDFQVEAVYYRPDGSVFSKFTVDTYIQTDWTSSYHHGSWGWRDPGNWQLGTYRIELRIENRKIAEGVFEIVR